MNKTLGSIVLAGAMTILGTSCAVDKHAVKFAGHDSECYALEMKNGYSCEGCIGSESRDAVTVTKGEQLIGAKLIVKNCEGDNCMPPVSYMAQIKEVDNAVFFALNNDGAPYPNTNMSSQEVERCEKASRLVKKCEQLLEVKYKLDF